MKNYLATFALTFFLMSVMAFATDLYDHHRRVSLNPAPPRLEVAASATHGWTGAVILPLHGKHQFRLLTDNVDSVDVEAYRLDPALAADKFHRLVRFVTAGALHTAVGRVEWAAAIKADDEGISPMTPEMRQTGSENDGQDKRTLGAYRRSAAAAVQEILAAVPQTPLKQTVTIPARTGEEGEGVSGRPQETVVDWDAMAGGKVVPGYYWVKLTPHTSPAVRRTLEGLGLPPDTLDMESYIFVNITDLNVSDSNYFAIITRLSDGSTVEHARITRRDRRYVIYPKDVREVAGGFLCFEDTFPEGDWNDVYVVEAGDDYTLFTQKVRSKPYERHFSCVQTDRSLYSPGDEVHVRGLLRRIDRHGKASLPELEEAGLYVTRPGGAVVFFRKCRLDASGGIDETFTLPKDGEDVTGIYHVKLQTDVNGYFQAEPINVENVQEGCAPQPEPVITATDARYFLEPSAALGDDGMLHISKIFPQAGRAHIIVSDEFGALRHSVHPVQEGRQEILLPAEGLEGCVHVYILPIVEDASGCHVLRGEETARLPLPKKSHALQISLDVPQGNMCPGEAVTLSGQVMKDGKGAPSTVTLFVVDAAVPDILPVGVMGWNDFFSGHAYKVDDMGYPCSIDIHALGRRRDGEDDRCADIHDEEEGGEDDEYDDEEEEEDDTAAPRHEAVRYVPHLNPRPTALWQGALRTDAEGRFSATVNLPDTPTIYRVYVMAAGDDGSSFGNAETELKTE